jgi:NAD(P)-dependent dehydrogenase (short-subunit alcohol dehydrogenase family)
MLKDKTVMIIGAGGLIGQAVTKSFVQAGAACVVADFYQEKAELVAECLRSMIPQARLAAVAVDITDSNSVNQLFTTAEQLLQGCDAVVNVAYPRNATYGKMVEEVTYEGFCENLCLHLGGYFQVTQSAAAFFKKKGRGVVLNFASIYGVIAPRFELYEGTAMTVPVEYGAIKAGLIHLTRYYAKYYAKDGVRFNCISPGGVKDTQPEQFINRYEKFCGTKGMVGADDVAGVAAFLVSDYARCITGQNIIVDDGFVL